MNSLDWLLGEVFDLFGASYIERIHFKCVSGDLVERDKFFTTYDHTTRELFLELKGNEGPCSLLHSIPVLIGYISNGFALNQT